MKRAGSCSALHALAPCHSCSSSSIFVARIKAAALPQLLPLLNPLLLLLLIPLPLPLSPPSSGLHSAILFALRLLWHFYFTPLLGNIFWPCPPHTHTFLNFVLATCHVAEFCIYPWQGLLPKAEECERGRGKGGVEQSQRQRKQKVVFAQFSSFLKLLLCPAPAALPRPLL